MKHALARTARRTTLSRFALRSPIIGAVRRGLLTESRYSGPTEPPLLDETCGSHFTKIVNQFGDRTAVVSSHQNIRLTYHDLQEKSSQLAKGLRNRGVKHGDRVVVSLGNNAEFAIAHYACFKLGAVLVPLNPAFGAMQVVSALNHLEATHLILSLETNLAYKPPRTNVPLLEQILTDVYAKGLTSEKVPSLRDIIIVDNTSSRISPSAFPSLTLFDDVLHDGVPGPAFVESGTNPHDLCDIQFTSGTTSMPKAACLTHVNILNNGKSIGDRMNLTERDVVVCPPPLFHCFGCVLGFMACMTHGATIVFPAEAFDPLKTLHAVQVEKATALYGVPTMYLAELELINHKHVKYEGFENLRTGIAAGSSIPSELMKKLHKTLNLTELTICYGMTETSPVSAMTFPDDPIEKRVDSVGRLMPHVSAKIVDPHDRTKVLPIGQRGELVTAGYLLQKFYWNDPVRTAEVMETDENGVRWMYTGDEAEMDADGYIKITGRIKDLIIRGGENIHPLEIENILYSHPSVAEVSVIGLPDEKHGECVAAWVTVGEGEKLTAAEVREWVKNKVSGHLVPKYVFWISELEGGLPKTASGKIMKFKLVDAGKEFLKNGKGLK